MGKNERFKFRAWNKEKRVMSTVHKMFLAYAIEDDLLEVFESNRYEVMQSTGLRDKNGKLIFEGDILKNTYRSKTAEYEIIEYVYWNDKITAFCTIGTQKKNGLGELTSPSYSSNYHEIIGNIYENPVLLEGK